MSWVRIVLRSFALAFVASLIAVLVVAMRRGDDAHGVTARTTAGVHDPLIPPRESNHDLFEHGFIERYRQILGCGRGRVNQLTTNRELTGFDGAGGLDPGTRDPASRNFLLTLSSDGASVPRRFEKDLQAGARRAYDLWRDWLGETALVPTRINLRIVGDEQRFDELYGQTPSRVRAVGFYRIRSNEAFVLYAPPYRRNALATAFHEMSHLITAWHLGPTPPWLNEGIAEYLETLRVELQLTRFEPSQQHLRVLRQSGMVQLRALLEIPRGEWGQGNAHLRYATAWAVVAFLQSSSQGRETLRNVIEEAYRTRCDGTAEISGALYRYAGGIEQLERDLRLWLRTLN